MARGASPLGPHRPLHHLDPVARRLLRQPTLQAAVAVLLVGPQLLQPRLEKLWADQKYRNGGLESWLAQQAARYRIEVVQRPVGAKGGGPAGHLPRRLSGLLRAPRLP